MNFKSLFLGFCMMSFSLVGKANFYEVENVATKATAENAKLAKTNAMEQAQVQAFSRLIQRLTGDESRARNLPEVKDIIAMVQEMSIQEEKNTKTDYWATVNVVFRPTDVQNYLNTKGWEFLKKVPPKLLVIPVYKKSGQILAGLEEENPLFQFLRSQDLLSDFYPLILPNGDLDEIVVVNQTLQQSPANWEVIQKRYGAEGVLIVEAEEVGINHWQLTGERIIENQKRPKVEAFDWYQGYTLSQAWDVLMQQMEHDWRENQKAPEEKTYYARLSEPTLQAWVQDKKQLESLKFLKNLMVQGVFKNQMLISYTYQGSGDLAQDWEKAGWVYNGDLMGPSGSLTRKEVIYE